MGICCRHVASEKGVRRLREAPHLAALAAIWIVAAAPSSAGPLPTSVTTIATASPSAVVQIYWTGWGCVPWDPHTVLGSSVSGLVFMKSDRPASRYAYRDADCPYYGYYVTQADSPDYFGRFYAGSFYRPGHERRRYSTEPVRRRR